MQMVGSVFQAIQSRCDPAFMLYIHRTYNLPELNYATPIRSPYLRQKINELETILRWFTKRLTGLAQHKYGKRLRNLSLLSL